jgi:Leucine-rich repeat (LRR) protein
MNKSILRRITLSLFLFVLIISQPAFTQEQDSLQQDAQQIENYKEQIKRLVGFLEFSLNTLGDPETSVKEKEVIINESFLKAFLNDKVQIEDDLDENREMVTHKDVQAYLKDVDFFFQYVEYDINIQDIQPQTTEDGMLYFIVTANRQLKGTTVEEDTVNNTKVRYIEVNLDEEEQVLKIASIYTTKINEKEELMAWWNNMPPAWKEILGKDLEVSNGIYLKDIEFLSDSTLGIVRKIPEIHYVDTVLEIGGKMVHIEGADTLYQVEYDTIPSDSVKVFKHLLAFPKMEELNISGNLYVRSLEPIEQLTALTSLNFSNTLIDDLFPVRNLTRLEQLHMIGTPVSDIHPLKYNIKIKELYLDGTSVEKLDALDNLSSLETLHLNRTMVDSIHPLAHLPMLKDLRMKYTPVTDITPLSELTKLEILDISGSSVTQLDALEFLVSLKMIYLENTQVGHLDALSRLDNLQVIDLDNTPIDDLEPLMELESLKKIYCDQSGVVPAAANEFMLQRPGVIVIYESEALTKWWAGMAAEWKMIFRKSFYLDTPPTIEQLHGITLMSSVDISKDISVTGLEPVAKLLNLKEIYCQGTSISNLEPLKELIDLVHLDCSDTRIKDLTPLAALVHLEELRISGTLVTSLNGLESVSGLETIHMDNTMVDNLEYLSGNKNLRTIYCDGTKIGKVDVDSFLDRNPECLVIYETPILKAWWQALSPEWHDIFRENIKIDDPPKREQLHSLVRLKSIDISGNESIRSLEPLTIFDNLEILDLSNTMVGDISTLSSMVTLLELNLSGNPLNDLIPVASLLQLKSLDISNTAVEKLDPVAYLENLEYLNCSGTPVKKLNPIETLFQLRILEINNTNIKNIKPLESLVALRQLKCFNTSISPKNIEKFKTANPKVEVVYY